VPFRNITGFNYREQGRNAQVFVGLNLTVARRAWRNRSPAG
jgi:hypothetical protein